MNAKKTKQKKAFTVAEMLVALAIMAMLLAALAVAMHAAGVNYEQNEALFRLTNTARQALLRITAELRTATAVAVTEPATQCSLVTSDGRNITYQYNADDDTLYLVTNDNLFDDDYILCKNVSAITFTKTTVPTDPSAIRNVQISLTVSDDTITKTLATAVVIRKNLE